MLVLRIRVLIEGGDVSVEPVATSYEYDFNIQDDSEGMTGGTGVQDYGFRLYNKAAGRFLSIDPLTSSYPMLTPYQFASNSPIVNIDLDGLESHPSIFGPGADGRPRILSASDNTVVHSIYSAENPTVDLAAIEQSTYMPEPALHKIFSGLLAAVTAPLNAISNDHAAGNARRLGNEARANELTTLSNEQYIEAAVGSAVGWGVGKTLRLGSTPISAPVKASVELQSSALRMSDDIIEGAFNTTSGETLDFMGQALVTRNSTGTTLEITEGILYPNNIVGNALKNEIGPRAILQTKNEIVKFAKAEGHSELRLQFRRAPNSSSANPGKNTEFIIDLKK